MALGGGRCVQAVTAQATAGATVLKAAVHAKEAVLRLLCSASDPVYSPVSRKPPAKTRGFFSRCFAARVRPKQVNGTWGLGPDRARWAGLAASCVFAVFTVFRCSLNIETAIHVGPCAAHALRLRGPEPRPPGGGPQPQRAFRPPSGPRQHCPLSPGGTGHPGGPGTVAFREKL